MTAAEAGGVRPTKRCLTDIGLKFPPVNTPLLPLAHPLIEKAQQLPAEAAAGGAERVLSLDDRVWFKVKISNYRGAATKLKPEDTVHPELLEATDAWWWICTAGERKSDSRSDFYKSVEAEATRAGTGSGRVSTAYLLPQEIDFKRLDAEVALQATLAIRHLTRRLIYDSLTSGKVVSAEFSHYVLKACVRAREEEAYIAIAAEGFINQTILAIVLDAVPDIAAEDWQVEPGGAMGVEVAYGQIVFSTVIPPEAQARMIELFADVHE
jgi:hypothetical protein